MNGLIYLSIGGLKYMSGVVLTDEQALLCRECIKNKREIENVLNQMKELSTDFILRNKKNKEKV